MRGRQKGELMEAWELDTREQIRDTIARYAHVGNVVIELDGPQRARAVAIS